MGKEDVCWPGRFRSAREKRRAVKLDFDKQLLQLGRERQKLWKQQRNLGYEPLIPPVQKGFKRFFVLRDDVAQSPRAEFFQSILDKINTTQYSDTREFNKKRRYRGKKIKVAREQKLRPIWKCEWQRLQLPPEQAVYFELTEVPNGYGEWFMAYQFTEPWRFRLKVAPNIITQKRIKDADLEQRLTEIKNYLERNGFDSKLNKLEDGNARYYSNVIYLKLKYKNQLKNTPFHAFLERAIEDEFKTAEAFSPLSDPDLKSDLQEV